MSLTPWWFELFFRTIVLNMQDHIQYNPFLFHGDFLRIKQD